ncbi:DUF885 domain-containing protein [Hyphococcus sp.]|uniref:DUF885 domain-containing protein n=1 Tax=Hyphococcus sp. TaxID=2038636 RepID=UPI0020806C7B|nr:MAG: hypothetical protein DHS20C04_11220 [Marinicaulis sp.]
MPAFRLRAALFVLAACIAAPAGFAQEPLQPAPEHEMAPDTLQSIIDDYWAWGMEENPVFATSLGVRDYDDRLRDPSLKGIARREAKTADFVQRLEALDTAALSEDEQVNYKLLLLDLKNDIEAAKFGGKYFLMTNRYGPQNDITDLADRLPFFTLADYESYVARLQAAPAYLQAATATLRAGAEAGWTRPCEAMEGVEDAIRYHVVADANDSVLMKPFEKQPATISTRNWRQLKADAADSIDDKVIPALAAFADFYVQEYAPACKDEIGASALPDGLAYYALRAKVSTTTDKTPDEIHKIGLSEVKRIRSEMDKVIKSTGFEGDFKAFQEFLRTDPQFYAKTPEELLAANALVAKKADGALTQLFTRMPRMPYTVKPIPDDTAEGTTTAYYEPPAGDGSRPGVYRVNTSKLDTRPLFEIEALTLHEAVPGHHFQIALAQETELPNFRKYGFFTAFVEGWGLYAESLGRDAGFYQDPYSDFGRLSYEMWRACRLVVDTGIHTKGWSKQQAIDYMADNTALSLHNIEAEVNRYITNPGQALAYKMGELKMQALRKRAQDALGREFDLRRFNDALLANGAVPLSVLEENIDAWIAAEQN